MRYECKITECSAELTAKNTLLMKDISNAKMFDNIINEGESFTFKPSMYAILDIHNEDSVGNPDYRKYVIVDENGEKYVTGSASFFESFIEIFTAMNGTDEEYAISVTKYPSRNFAGKYFLKCSIV